MSDLSFHPLAEAFPLVDDSRLRELAEDIRSHGLIEPIVVFEGMILDGRNRLRACSIAGVEPRLVPFGGTFSEAAALVISKNVMRRDLNPGQRAAAILKLEELVGRYREDAKRAQGARTDLSAPVHRSSKDVLSRVASDSGASRRTVASVSRVKSEDPELFEKIHRGEIEAKRAERILRDREAAKKREERVKREADVSDVPPPDIRTGSLSEALEDVRDVDLVFTDPPYPREFLESWSELSRWASSALKPGALLVAYSGQYHLPEVMARLGENLVYQWLGWLATAGPNVSVHQRPIMSGGKPVLFYSNGPLKQPFQSRRFVDAISSEHRTRDEHKWEQAQGPAAYYIEALTERGELVVDPFVGSGTFALVAATLGRRFIGSDIDPGAVLTARRRVAA